MTPLLKPISKYMPFIGIISCDHMCNKVYLSLKDHEFKDKYYDSMYIYEEKNGLPQYQLQFKQNSIVINTYFNMYHDDIECRISRDYIKYKENKYSIDDIEVAMFEIELDIRKTLTKCL